MAAPARALPAEGYTRRDPRSDVLHIVVREHLETFLAEMEQRGDERSVPCFVERKLRRYLKCGVLAHGFVRLRCTDCRTERLVPLACKGRGLCPSCDGRRMVERAAHLVDNVFSRVPVRQWVLSLPFELRLRLAFDHELCRKVHAVFARGVEGFYRDRAKRAGRAGGKTGCVTVIQRGGSALNANVHFHSLVIDGTFHEQPDGSLRFYAQKPPTDEEIETLLTTITARIKRLLQRRGLWEPGDELPDLSADMEPPALGDLTAASISQTVATGPRADQRVRKLGVPVAEPEPSPRARKARIDGFDLHASDAVAANSRGRLERMCRYLLRPLIVNERLELTDDGQVRLELKNRWNDGTTHILLSPQELLEKVVVLIPRPNINLIIYHGVLAPRHKWRSRVVAYRRKDEHTDAAPEAAGRNVPWAELMHRSFGIDALACPGCGGRLRLIATILSSRVAIQILRHLDSPADPVYPEPARAPPDTDDIVFDISA